MAESIPQDLHQLNYATRILEDLGLPRKGNLELVADCVESVSKQRRIALHEAFAWLSAQCSTASKRGVKVDRWWFQNGDYQRVEPPEPKFKGTFVPIDKERTRQEQATPEWEEANTKLRTLVANIAAGNFGRGTKQASAAEQKRKLREWVDRKDKSQ